MISRRIFGFSLVGIGLSSSFDKVLADSAPPPAPIPKAALPRANPDKAAKKSGPRILCYVGGYTRSGPAESNATGITLFEMNAQNGILTQLGHVTPADNPSFLALSPDQNTLYTVNEMSDFEGGHTGSVTASGLTATQVFLQN
nr:beta-propeller fold lactonase family protein [Acetobacter okinawensis]